LCRQRARQLGKRCRSTSESMPSPPGARNIIIMVNERTVALIMNERLAKPAYPRGHQCPGTPRLSSESRCSKCAVQICRRLFIRSDSAASFRRARFCRGASSQSHPRCSCPTASRHHDRPK
jgi:hypothetical protein